MNPEDIAVQIVALNGGRLVGKTRLQKTAFLMEAAGMNAGLEFVYHHYGPFCSDLARGWEEAALDGQLTLEEHQGSKEMPYTIFSTHAEMPESIGELPRAEAQELLRKMDRYSDTVLEIAATIMYLSDEVDDPIEEVQVRKPHKANSVRLGKAQRLITELGLTF